MRVLLFIVLVLVCGSGVRAQVSAPWAWTEEAKLLPNDPWYGDNYGWSVFLSGDTAVVGNLNDTHHGFIHAGSAYVYVRNGAAWSQQAKLLSNSPRIDARLGRSVSLSGDTALVGASGDYHYSWRTGAAYVFVRTGTVWSRQAKLTHNNGQTNDNFGWSVSVSGDRALIGATGIDAADDAEGRAYVFVRTGTTWSQRARLTASDPLSSHYFGIAVALQGDTALVGTRYSGQPIEAGAVHVFVHSARGWSEQAVLTASDAVEGDTFGDAVALDGERALIGAHGDDDGAPGSGSAYVFERSGTTWTETARLTAPVAIQYERFGSSVSLSGDTALIGGKKEAAYLFEHTGTGWVARAELSSSDGSPADLFGYAVSVSGDTSLVAAREQASGQGAAYVMRTCDTSVQGTETTRLGSPPNPHAFRPGVTSAPCVGSIWDPVIDHETFALSAVADFAGVDLTEPINVPTPMGTLLISPPSASEIFVAAPGAPFAIPVPSACALIGRTVWTQGGSFNAPGIELANAIDVVLGTY